MELRLATETISKWIQSIGDDTQQAQQSLNVLMIVIVREDTLQVTIAVIIISLDPYVPYAKQEHTTQGTNAKAVKEAHESPLK